RARLEHAVAHRRPWPTGSAPLATLPIGSPLVLFLPASPVGPAAVEDEALAIARALATTAQLGFQSLADAPPDQLLRMLGGDPQRALHVSGPARDGTIVLTDDDERATPVSSGPLTALVRELAPDLRLVVLHGRGGRELAAALAASVPCVIALDAV